LQDPQHRHGHRHGRGLVALADQIQDPVATQGVGVVLDPGFADLFPTRLGRPSVPADIAASVMVLQVAAWAL